VWGRERQSIRNSNLQIQCIKTAPYWFFFFWSDVIICSLAWLLSEYKIFCSILCESWPPTWRANFCGGMEASLYSAVCRFFLITMYRSFCFLTFLASCVVHLSADMFWCSILACLYIVLESFVGSIFLQKTAVWLLRI